LKGARVASTFVLRQNSMRAKNSAIPCRAVFDPVYPFTRREFRSTTYRSKSIASTPLAMAAVAGAKWDFRCTIIKRFERFPNATCAVASGKFVVLRVPYPMGFYAKGMDGRIDDPKAGWKGKGLWATYGTRTPFHAEGGKGTTSKVLHFQLRPDPLAH
jgi:hypothetical protein